MTTIESLAVHGKAATKLLPTGGSNQSIRDALVEMLGYGRTEPRVDGQYGWRPGPPGRLRVIARRMLGHGSINR